MCWCYPFEVKTADEQTPRQEEYQLHIRQKDYVNSLKKDHAERAKEDQTFLTCNFDLEAVLYSPLFFAKPIFYKSNV